MAEAVKDRSRSDQPRTILTNHHPQGRLNICEGNPQTIRRRARAKWATQQSLKRGAVLIG